MIFLLTFSAGVGVRVIKEVDRVDTPELQEIGAMMTTPAPVTKVFDTDEETPLKILGSAFGHEQNYNSCSGLRRLPILRAPGRHPSRAPLEHL